jgi:hypothetical protein
MYMTCLNVLLQEKRLRVSTEILSALKRWGRTATTASSDAASSGHCDVEGVVGDGVSPEDIELARKGMCTHMKR